ncbi:amidohydrolase, partial [Muribaculaceae bacterium Isolate-002 (NCI)]
SEAQARTQGFFDPNNVGKIVDLKGKSMLPGFVDGHSHFPNQGRIDLFQVNMNSPPIGAMNSIVEDYIPALAARAAQTEKGKVVDGVGYDDTLVKERRHPTKEDLDKASLDHPIVVLHTSEHLRAANSLALKNS